MIKNFLILIFITILTSSCYYGVYNSKPKITSKKIRLEKELNADRLFTFENKSSVIFLDIKDIIYLINKKLNDNSLCEQKIIKYATLIDKFESSDKNGFDICAAINPEVLKQSLADFDTTQTGVAPLDFYSRIIGNDLTKNKWIEPYGFQPAYVDTINAIKFNDFYSWVITDLILKGKAQVLKKNVNEYQDYVIFEIVDFRDGHGGESLLFKEKQIFMTVDVYSDIDIIDFDCMD